MARISIKSISQLVLITLLLQGCAALGPKPAEAIIGQWQTQVGNFPVSVTYEVDTVRSGTNMPVPYGLTGNQLTYADGGQQVRFLSFPVDGEMIQLDPVTGTEHRFTRLP
ncbi:MAG: hypothetical protein ACI82A_002496 [Candidatus Azotimanducaceae bacterium]|jgi:hypothetical protein